MRIGIAEFGSTSLRMLVAEFRPDGSFDTIKTDSFRYSIDPDAVVERDVAQAMVKLDAFHDDIASYRCDRVVTYGTALCRKLAKSHPSSLRPYLRILTPGEEAITSWAAGFMSTRNAVIGRRLTVIDLGGGSTEVVTATWAGTHIADVCADSLDIGSDKITNLFEATPSEFPLASQRLVAPHAQLLSRHAAKGVGDITLLGSVATKLAWLERRAGEDDFYKPHLVNGYEIKFDNVMNRRRIILAKYEKNPEEARLYVDSRQGSEGEAPRVIAGSAFLMWILVKLAPKRLFVSSQGTRHGVAFLAMKGLFE